MNSASEQRPVRIGILGCATIAEAFARDLRGSHLAQVVAVASRDHARAEDFAGRHGIERHLGSYEALIDDPHVDVVYLPLPNSLHMHWCLKAFARVIRTQDFAAIDRAASASLDIAATLEAIAKSARQGREVDL